MLLHLYYGPLLSKMDNILLEHDLEGSFCFIGASTHVTFHVWLISVLRIKNRKEAEERREEI